MDPKGARLAFYARTLHCKFPALSLSLLLLLLLRFRDRPAIT